MPGLGKRRNVHSTDGCPPSPGTKLAKGQVPHHELITLRTAHDIRRLRTCPHCDGIGHADSMAFSWPYRKDGTTWDESYYHGRCFVAEFGFDALLDLPEGSGVGNLTLGDLGVDLMKRLFEQRG